MNKEMKYLINTIKNPERHNYFSEVQKSDKYKFEYDQIIMTLSAFMSNYENVFGSKNDSLDPLLEKIIEGLLIVLYKKLGLSFIS